MAICNGYKDTFNNLLDNSDTKSLDWLRPINKRLHNTLISENSLTRLLKGDYLDKNILDRSLQLMPQIRDSEVYQPHDITIFGLKSGRS